jgi:hypothetical protein
MVVVVVVVVGMMSEVVRRCIVVVIIFVMNCREDVDVGEVAGAEEVGMQEEMMEEGVVTSEGCRMADGMGEVDGALLLRLGRLCGGTLRLTGGDRI